MKLDELKNLWNSKEISGSKLSFTEDELAEILNRKIQHHQKQIAKRLFQEIILCVSFAILLVSFYVSVFSQSRFYNTLPGFALMITAITYLISCTILFIYSNRVVRKGFVLLNIKDAIIKLVKHYRRIEKLYLYSSTLCGTVLLAIFLYSDYYPQLVSIGLIGKAGLWLLLTFLFHIFHIYYIKKRFGNKVQDLERLNKEFIN